VRAFLFVRQPGELDETQQAELTLIRQASPSAEAAYHLTQAFMQMVRERSGHQLDTWLSEVAASHLPEFASFAAGVELDKAAVLAGLTLPWSNGPTEGHVTRLKLLKRSMYGRAKLPLLRQRVLGVAWASEQYKMMMNKDEQSYTIWIEAEEWVPGAWTPEDDTTDVIVTWEDGSRWGASFFSYKHIQTVTEKNKRTGECLAGAYFWASDMLLIDRVSRQRIEEVIAHLLKEDEFKVVFTPLPSEEVEERPSRHRFFLR
jgi:hypothetical protein